MGEIVDLRALSDAELAAFKARLVAAIDAANDAPDGMSVDLTDAIMAYVRECSRRTGPTS